MQDHVAGTEHGGDLGLRPAFVQAPGPGRVGQPAAARAQHFGADDDVADRQGRVERPAEADGDDPFDGLGGQGRLQPLFQKISAGAAGHRTHPRAPDQPRLLGHADRRQDHGYIPNATWGVLALTRLR